MRRFITCILTVTGVLVLSSIDLRAEETPSFERGELIAISGPILENFFNAPPENLSLWAMTPEGFEPVPFQIDERYIKRGKLRYAYTGGKKAGKDPDPKLDENDELVFWSGDAGQRVPESSWPSETQGIEITIEDAISGSVGYVYFLKFPDRAPRSGRRYISYNAEDDRIESLYYIVDFTKNRRLGFVDLSINPRAGGSGEDFIDEVKFWADLKAIGGAIQYSLSEEDVYERLEAWIDGPVRVKRKIRTYTDLWMWLGSTSRAECTYTPSGFSIEVPITGPWPVKTLAGGNYRWTMELNETGKGMIFRSDKNPDGVKIDGEMSESERGLDYSPPGWILLTGRPGTILRRAGKSSKRPLYLDLYYMDNENLLEEPEVGAGQIGANGYYIPYPGRRGWKVSENIVEFYEILPDYNPGDEEEFFNKLQTPLVVKVDDKKDYLNPPSGPEVFPEPRKARKDGPTQSYNYVGDEAIKTESQLIPIFFANSDIGFGGGLTFIHADPFDRGFRMAGITFYTTKSLAATGVTFGEAIPREDSDWSWSTNVRYSNQPARDFFGLGNDSSRDNETNFHEEYFRIRLTLMRRIWGKLWMGTTALMFHDFIGGGEGESSPDTFDPSWFPNLFGKGEWWTNRLGGFIHYDTRDNYYNPTKGGLWKIEYYGIDEWMGSDFSFEYWYLDIRRFIHLRKPRRDVLAMRLQAKHAEGGPIPFYELAVAGSDRTLRGYPEGRFRDRDMMCVNVDLRHKLWKIVYLNLFYDIGRVYGDIFEEGNHLFTNLHDAYGTGLRLSMPPDLVLRIDFGWSKTDQTFYLDFGHTF